MKLRLYQTEIQIPIFVTDKLGLPYEGDITVSIYKNGIQEQALGSIVKAEKGLYFYQPRSNDINTLGTFIVLITGESAFGHALVSVVSYDPSEGPASAEDIWAYPYRTLVQPGTKQSYPQEGDPLVIFRDSTNTIEISTGIEFLDDADRYELWFTIKEVLDDPDSEALLQINSKVGLIYINRLQSSGIDGGIPPATLTANRNGLVEITLRPEASGLLSLYSVTPITWDLKLLDNLSGSIIPIQTGTVFVKPTATRAQVSAT